MKILDRVSDLFDIDNESYVYQCWLIFVAITPLAVLGELYNNEKFEICVTIAETVVSVALIVAICSKKKTCPKYVHDAVVDFISIYLWIFLPSIILILHGHDDWKWIGLGFMLAIFGILSGLLHKKTKADAKINIETIKEIKAEATDNSQLVELLFNDKWKVVNKLCNIYYEKSDSTGSLKFIVRDIEAELEELRSAESIADILATTDRCLDGAITQLRSECGSFIKEQDIEFIGLIFSGLSVRAVCYLTGMRKPNFYQKKNRMIKRIAGSEAPHREEFVERLSNFTK